MKRRDFMGVSGAVIATGLTAACERVSEQHAMPARGPANPPTGKITVGCIGVGGRGTSVMKEFLAEPDVEIAAICDLDSEHLARAIEIVEKSRGKKPEGYKDFRKLLERNDLDAVTIATPDHWHALAAIYAMESGRDVYVEKPLCHSIAEGKRMVEVARANQRITQLGTQIHNHPSQNYARVAKTVQSGILGKIQKVRCWKTDELQNIGNPADSAPPPTLDYDMWLGPAPASAYNPNRSHFNWRWFWEYGGGKFGDFGCHIMDIAFWSMGVGTASSAQSIGGKFVTEDNSTTPDTLEVLFEYPNFSMVFSLVVGDPLGFYGMGGIGCIFQGTKGTLVTNYTDHKIFANGDQEKESPKPQIELPPHIEHAREFLDGVKSRKRTSCDIEYGNQLTNNIHLGNIALRTGTKVGWDAENQTIVGTREAVRMMTPEMRKPWRLT